ncbi:MAG: DinB family protein [Gemmatimonadales bacterium]
MTPQEFETFLKIWDEDAQRTITILQALPKDSYDFRPDPGARSIGEMAWHLAEGDAYNSVGVAEGGFSPDMRPPGMERPKQIEALAPGYERIHREAVARVRKLKPADLERKISFFTGEERSGGWILWGTLFHNIHHRGQLSLMCRLAGGVSPAIFGPNREEMAAMRGQADGA